MGEVGDICSKRLNISHALTGPENKSRYICLSLHYYRILLIRFFFFPLISAGHCNTKPSGYGNGSFTTYLKLCKLGKFLYFFSSDFFFLKIDLFKKFFLEYHQSVKQLGIRSGPP